MAYHSTIQHLEWLSVASTCLTYVSQQDFIENGVRNDSDLAATQVSVTIPKDNHI